MDKRLTTLGIALLLAGGLLTGCSPTEGEAGAGAGPGNYIESPEGGIAAYVDGQPITVEELKEVAQAELNQLEMQKFQMMSQALDRMIADQLLAREAEAQGIPADEILKTEMDKRLPQPSEDEIQAFYDQNKDHPRAAGFSLEDLRSQIVAEATRSSRKQASVSYFKELKRNANVEVKLREPRLKVDVPDDEPTFGAEDSLVTVVEFSDYQCSFCKTQHSSVQQLLSEYGDRIRFVYRDFPIANIHPRAFPAAMAARCAGEQDRYWDYHNNLWLSQGDLGDDDLKGRASRLGLDETLFAECYDSGRLNDKVQSSFDDGRKLGITGTPTFFINGRVIKGSRSYGDLKRVVDEELAAAGA